MLSESVVPIADIAVKQITRKMFTQLNVQIFFMEIIPNTLVVLPHQTAQEVVVEVAEEEVPLVI